MKIIEEEHDLRINNENSFIFKMPGERVGFMISAESSLEANISGSIVDSFELSAKTDGGGQKVLWLNEEYFYDKMQSIMEAWLAGDLVRFLLDNDH